MKTISFNQEITKPILCGVKTQTRRAVKIKNHLTRHWAESSGVEWIKELFDEDNYKYSIREQNACWNDYSDKDFIAKYSNYQIGDTLWVRESAKIQDVYTCHDRKKTILSFNYLADNEYREIELPKRYDNTEMPNWMKKCHSVPNGCIKEMARIFLKITNVRVERLNDISEHDLIKEGISSFRERCETVPDFDETLTNKDLWEILWDTTTKDSYKWNKNPFVFVYEFERVEI